MPEAAEAAATAIQRCFRSYLRRRYRDVILNFDDDDVFSMDPVCLTPRKLLYVLEARDKSCMGFHAAHLLRWLLTKPVHPLTRQHMQRDVIDDVYRTVLVFVRTDRVLHAARRGHFRRRKPLERLVKQYRRKAARQGRIGSLEGPTWPRGLLMA